MSAMTERKVYTVVLFFIGVIAVASQQQARCLSFTWLGPRYHNGSEFLNATCEEATRLADGVPCFSPLVVSYDGTEPDTDYIWLNHGDQASCILANTDVCATYSFFFNGLVENITRMCTRVEESLGRPISSGCYESSNGNWKTRVCFCRSVEGGVPCNDAFILRAPAVLPVLLFAAIFIIYGVKGD